MLDRIEVVGSELPDTPNNEQVLCAIIDHNSGSLNLKSIHTKAGELTKIEFARRAAHTWCVDVGMILDDSLDLTTLMWDLTSNRRLSIPPLEVDNIADGRITDQREMEFRITKLSLLKAFALRGKLLDIGSLVRNFGDRPYGIRWVYIYPAFAFSAYKRS